jgi:hypothetical protein
MPTPHDDTTTMNVTRKSRRTVAGKGGRATAAPEGCPQGRHLDHWLKAESELRG